MGRFKKKAIWMVLIIGMLLVLAPGLAEAVIGVRVEAPTSVNLGDTFTAKVKIDKDGDSVVDLIMVRFKLTFNPSVLQVSSDTGSVRAGSLVTGYTVSQSNYDNVAGWILALIKCPTGPPCTNPVTGTGPLAEVDFKVIGTPQSDIKLSPPPGTSKIIDLGDSATHSIIPDAVFDATVSVCVPPSADFTVSNTSPCPSAEINFTDRSSGTNITSWMWNFGDGDTSSLKNPSYAYSTPGTYTVTLTVSGDCGTDSKTRTNYITVIPSPSADFTASDTTPCPGIPVSFTDKSTGNITGWAWSFGDGSPDTTAKNPSHTYTTASIYTVKLTVTGPCGSDTKTKNNYITVGSAPTADFTASNTTPCAKSAISFTDHSTGNITSWLWNFGDGSPNSTAQNPSHTYTDTGTYTVRLTVTGDCGTDTKTKTGYIIVVLAPSADFTASDTTPCPGIPVSFTDKSTGNITSWAWSFGDGSPNTTAKNPSHTYTTAGIYTVKLTVTGLCGSNTKTKTNYITAGIKADFSATPLTACAGSTVNFTDTSIGDIASRLWNFGDGDTSTAQNPGHTHTDAGNYTVRLTVTGDCGTDTKTKTNYITVVPNVAVTADFNASSTTPCLTQPVIFTDSSTGAITSWSWNFGDAGTSSDSNPSHAYTTPGVYPVSLTVTGPCGSNTKTITNYIIAGLLASFSASDTNSCVGAGVSFNDTSIGVTDTWSWDFGDGNTSPDSNPTHIYTSVGIYTVSLTVTGPCGSNTITKPNYITAGIAADFRADSTSLCLGPTVSFTDVSTGAITSWLWNFGDGGTSSDSNTTHTYTSEGNYPVSLTVTGPCGSDTEAKTNYIIVRAAPAADFTVSSTTPCAKSGVNFTDSSTGSITSWSWTFGDGDTSALQHPTHRYTAAGNYTVSLTVTGPCGTNTKTRTGYITVTSSPAANFAASAASSCVGTGIDFTDKSSGSITSWQWTFGDGQGSTSQHPTHVYSAAGTYTVTLTVTGSCGSDTQTKPNYITVVASPSAEFGVSPTSPCVGSAVTFTDHSTGSIISHLWNFGDRATSTAQNSSHTYTTVGSYPVSLIVTGSCGVDTESKIVSVVPFPTADFTASTTTPCAGAAVGFTDHSIGTITSWLWDFGDGDTSSAQNPSHTYTTANTYTVSLTIAGPCGSDTETKTNFTVLARVTADFSADSTTSCPGQSVTFTDNSTGPATSWRWNFGDGSVANTTQNPTHTYRTVGTYTVSLAITGNCNTDTKTETNYITVSSLPSANFIVDTTNPCSGSSVTFTDNSTGNITSWSWDFGDGQTSFSRNPSHVYTAADTYTVTLTVTGPCGHDIETKTITVVPSPTADFTASDTSLCAGATVAFTDQSIGTIASWLWDFGDGNTSLAQNPSHTYTTADTYPVSLTITGFCGTDTETKTNYITVLPSVSAGFTLSSTTPCSGSSITFNDSSTGAIASWRWDFGDRNISTAQNPSHTYTSTGTYPVSLTVTGACGTDTRTQYLTVDAVKADFAATPASGYQPLAVTFTNLSTGNVTSWLWDFGDGQTSTTQNPAHTYTTADTYTVSLTVSGLCGSDTKTRTNYINVTIPAGPSPPTNLTAKPISTNQIELSWQDNSTDEIGFKIERKKAGELYQPIAVLGANTTTYLDKGLSPETTYYYRLKAYNLLADSPYSNETLAATLGPLRVLINAPAAVTKGDTFKITLQVTSITDLKSVYFFPDFDPELFRFISAAPGKALVSLNPTMTANRYLLIPNPDSFTGSGDLIEMEFEAIGSAPAEGKIGLVDLDLGDIAGGLIVFPKPVIPAAVKIMPRILNIPAPPGNFNLEVISTSRIRLSWSDNSDNELGFEIYRKEFDHGDYRLINTTLANTTGYEDTGLSIDAIYCYQVRAYNSDGKSSWSKEAYASTRDVSPQAPANLTVRTVSSRQIELEWTDKSDNENGFKIERQSPGGRFIQIAAVLANVTSYRDDSLAPKTTYYYRVRAYNYVGNSDYSNQAQTATFPLLILEVKAPDAVAPGTEFETTIEVSWVQGLKTVFLIVDYNNIILHLLSLEAGDLISSANPGISFLNNRFQAVLGEAITGGGELVRMRFKAIGYSGGSSQIGLSAYFFGDSSGNEIMPDSTTSGLVFITGPLILPPDNLVAWPVSSNQIEMVWSDHSDNETGFEIERKTKGGSWFLLGTVPANTKTYSDLSSLKPNTTYYYRVRASHLGGSSAYSNEAMATTWDVSPSPPTNLKVAVLTNNVINLTWQDNSDNETGFKIERSKAGESYFLAGDVPPNTRTYTDFWVFEPNTTYYYRVRAYNLMGHSAYSNQAEATTSDIPPAPPTGLIAVALSSSSIDLTWRDNSDNETGFRIERRQEGDYAYCEIDTVSADTATYSDHGLKPRTNYFYRVIASNQVGDSAYSNEALASTWDIFPSPPTNLKATVVGSASVDLEWQDNSDNETGFKIERKKEGESYFLIGTVSANRETYSDLNIEPGTTYYYQVKASNQFGDSSYSNEIGVNIPAMGTVVKIIAPSVVQAGDTFEVSVEITEIEDLNTVEFNLVFDPLVFKVLGSPRPGDLTASAAPLGNLLSPGHYRVVINVPGLAGVDGAGSLAKMDLKSIGASSATSKLELSGFMLTNTSTQVIPVDAVIPAQVNVTGIIFAPYNLLAEARTSNLIHLSWQAISDDKTGFKIERKIKAGDYVQIKEMPAVVTTYLDSEVNPENTYCYQIRAYNFYTTSAPSKQACAAPGDLLPAAPTDLEAAALSGHQIQLSWKDNSNNELGFKVERRQEGEPGYSLIKIIIADTTTCIDAGLIPRTTYYYRVWSYNRDGLSNYSKVAKATTLDIPPTAPANLRGSEITSSSIMISWDDNSDNETGFRIERRTGTADDFDTMAIVMAGIEVYLDSGLTSETTYCYRVFAYNETGDSSYEEACFTTSALPPINPANLTVEAISSSWINLAWQDNSLNEDGFKIERRIGTIGAYTEIAAVLAQPGTGLVNYQDTRLKEGATYYYRVRAWNEAGGDSPYSNPAYATTPLPPPPSPLKIAFASGEGNKYDIYLMNEDGSNRESLVTSPGIDWEPNISLDGTRLVFSSDRDGDLEIYLINIDGTGLRQLTNNPSQNREPSFFPDGKRIVFVSDGMLYTMNIDTRVAQSVTLVKGNASHPSVSPDGNQIVFSSGGDIYTIGVDGLGLKQVTTHPADDQQPCFSPEGDRIAFSSNRDGDYEIYTIALDGTDLNQITNNGFDDVSPAFSPDKNYSQIGFSSDQNGNRDIYLVDRGEKRLTNEPIQDIQPSLGIGSVLAAPSNLFLTASSRTELCLSWQDNSGEETGFVIRRVQGDEVTELTGFANVTAYCDSNLRADLSYCYQVKARGKRGDSPYSNQVCFPQCCLSPEPPDDLKFSSLSDTAAGLSWRDNSSFETGFVIERKVDKGDYTTLTQVGAGVTTYRDENILPNRYYYYRIRAINEVDLSAPSNEICTCYPPASPTNLSVGIGVERKIILSWVDNSDETGFEIERRLSSSSYSWIATVSANTTTYTDNTNLEPSTYRYRIRAVNICGYSNYSESGDVEVPVEKKEAAVMAFPNPFYRKDAPRITFQSGLLTGGGEIRVYSQSGQLIKTLIGQGGDIVWEGVKNEGGREVTSGIYIYVIDTPKGMAKGKLSIIR